MDIIEKIVKEILDWIEYHPDLEKKIIKLATRLVNDRKSDAYRDWGYAYTIASINIVYASRREREQKEKKEKERKKQWRQ